MFRYDALMTQQLAYARFEDAKQFLFESARPLEKFLFMHLFAKLPPGQAVAELAGYANPDGGFGQALEPDLRDDGSSALATSVAMQVMRRCGLGADHELVRHTLRYLMDTLEEDGRGWRIIPDRARAGGDDKAPWWSAPPDATNTRAMFNPSAELLGYLIEWGVGRDAADAARRVGSFIQHEIETRPEPLESHELLCLMRLAQTPGLPEDLAAAVIPRLQRDAPRVVTTDPQQWGGYGLMPLWLAPTSDHFAVKALGDDLLCTNLDYLINHQDDPGCWNPTWDWGPDRRAGWEIARPDWQGVLTLNNLLTLRAYGRIAPE